MQRINRRWHRLSGGISDCPAYRLCDEVIAVRRRKVVAYQGKSGNSAAETQLIMFAGDRRRSLRSEYCPEGRRTGSRSYLTLLKLSTDEEASTTDPGEHRNRRYPGCGPTPSCWFNARDASARKDWKRSSDLCYSVIQPDRWKEAGDDGAVPNWNSRLSSMVRRVQITEFALSQVGWLPKVWLNAQPDPRSARQRGYLAEGIIPHASKMTLRSP